MKILLTSDFHIGVRGDSEIYHNIFKQWIVEFLVPTIKNEDISSLCILGDFYDNRNAVNTKSDNIGHWAIEYIIKKCNVNIYILAGNHDIFYKNSRKINSLKGFRYKNVFIIDEPINIDFGTRTLSFIPWVLEEEIDEIFKMKGDICLGHFPFNGFEMVHGVVETKGYSLDKIKNNFLKVYSGHFHLRNDVYVGNPFQMSWADTEDEKGVIVLDIDTLNEKFIPNKISPIYKKIYLSQLKNKTVSLDIIKGNFIKIFLDDDYSDKVIEKLQEVIKLKKPLSFTFDGLSKEEIENDIEVKDLVNPINSLISWLERIDIKKDIDRNILLSKMNDLYKEVI